MYTDLEKAKEGLKGFVKTKGLSISGEANYHLVQANHCMNPKWKNLSDNNYVIVSDSYLVSLKEHWQSQESQGVMEIAKSSRVLHSEKVPSE